MSIRKAVVLTAWRRPEYTHRVLEALIKCRGIGDYELLVQVDGGGDPEVWDVLKHWEGEGLPMYLKHPGGNLGVAGAPLAALKWAFDGDAIMGGFDYVLKLEDDAVLTADALELADWFLERTLSLKDHQMLMSLGAHEDKQGGPPNVVDVHDKITSPFAFCLHSSQWPFLRDHWNCKVQHPHGWDWSLTYKMRLHRRLTLAPALSRVENIGRELGVHDTPETFDRMQVGVRHHDGSKVPSYEVRVPDAIDGKFQLSDWMWAEYKEGVRP